MELKNTKQNKQRKENKNRLWSNYGYRGEEVVGWMRKEKGNVVQNIVLTIHNDDGY